MTSFGYLVIFVFGFVSAIVAAPPAPSFEKTVEPVLTNPCSQCHNSKLAYGGLNILPYTTAGSIAQHRDEWEAILRKIRSGEMPPKGVPRPPEENIAGLVSFVQAEFEKVDRSITPDPGRVTAHRLNRNEYTNTIRDLLGVDFRADKDFPTEDSGYGFDNIGEGLTISPVLMEHYLNAAESITARAIGANPLPKKPIEVSYAAKDRRIRRRDFSNIEATRRVACAAEDLLRFGLPGERAADAKPVMLGFWMDGVLLKKILVETKPSKLVYFNPYSEEEMRLYLPQGDHVFRAGFIDDDFVKDLSAKDAYSDKKNKFLNSIKFIGPFPTNIDKASRKKILICDPNSGPACVDRIVSTLARRAYRRPVTRNEVATLLKFVDLARKDNQSAEQGIQLALQAMLVSPNFLFRIEHDPISSGVLKSHPLSEFELASRLSYFLWSSMPDNELLDLAEAHKLRAPGVLDAQVKRMLADERSSALAANFAGQWLETRNLDTVKPDPQKFPEWDPALRDAMKTETRMFFEGVLHDNRPVSDFLDSRYNYANARLAKHYWSPHVTGAEFRRVDFTTDQRGGVLSQAGVLRVSSYPTRTSPVIRGKYVCGNILGTPPPPPPADVPPIDESAVGNTGSMRQQLETHRANSTCASCHSRMDPLGFGLENYDALGKWRTHDGEIQVDASGTLHDGKTFSSPAEMRAILISQLPEFSRCLTEKMLTYSLGRGLERSDRLTVDDLNKKLAASEYRFQTLIYEIVKGLPFQQ